ncbi:carbohydrate kinase [Candidatus Woesearchaeota archaeon]|nr:carbohydrate kinase [Candidatus Woesearchaeota archaeon]
MPQELLLKKIFKLKGEFDVLSIGELLTDYISQEDKPLKDTQLFDKFFGGSPANIVFHMKNLGKKPLLITKIGDDDDGHALLAKLEKHGIIQEHVKIDKEKQTTRSFIRRHPKTPEFEILRGADTQLLPEEIDLNIIKKAKIVHTNAFTLAEEPTRSTVLKVIKEAYQKKKIISFDPNYRLKVWPNKEEAMSVLKKVYKFADLTKPSLDDAREIFGKLEPEDYIRKFHELGAKIVVLTMGSQGSLISTGNDDENITILPEQCESRDPTGAGDVYWSVFLTALLDGSELDSAGRKASFAASRIVKKDGAILDDNEYDEIAAYMRLF